MFERFTERARHVVVFAQDEARALNHNYIGTEHILLGLLRQDEGLAARTLKSLGVTLEGARGQVAQIVGFGDEGVSGQIPFTPRAKKVLELSSKEALALGHNYIGTEHMLLGLARVNDGVAARILLDFGADADAIRATVLDLLSGYEVSQEISPAPPPGQQVTISVSRGADERFGDRLPFWMAEHFGLLASGIMFGVGILVGWLIWG